jgi:hypothetical protein
MQVWERFKSWLFRQRRQKYKISHPDLYVLDVEELEKELAIAEEAKKLGVAGIPAPDATVLCGVESTIVHLVHKARLDYVDWAQGRLQTINESLNRRDLSPLVERALQADMEFTRKASSLFAESEELIAKLARSERKTRTELDGFRQQHSLNRDAQYPTGAASFLRYSLLALLILIEGVANAWFFAQGLTGGLLGGFVAAATFAFLNLVLAFAIGKFLIRFVFHRQVWGKLLGIVAMATVIGLVMGISLTIAHYRDALVLDVTDPARYAWETMLNNTFGLYDVFSWLLFGISVFFAVVAVFDGLFSDDLYPGYGRLTRRAKAAHDEFFDEVDGLREDLKSLRQAEIDTLDESLRQAQSMIAQSADYIAAKKSAESRLATAISNADHCMQALIKRFQNTNAIYRNGIPVPSYFNKNPPVPPIALPNFATAQDEADLAQQSAKLDSLQQSINEIRANIQGAYNREYDRLKPLANQLGE